MAEPSAQDPDRPVPDPDCVREHLARVLRSSVLSNAASLRRFLSFVVERSLAGDKDGVKEYAIGVEVLGRGESFDPKIDTIVRVQARRLRAKLDAYYEAEGALDRVVIELPRGSYVPTFRSFELSKPGHGSGGGEGRPGPPNDGRERELDKLRGLLGREARLAIPTAGASKARFALQLALDGFTNDDRAWALRMARGFLAYCDWSEARRGRRAQLRQTEPA